MILYDFLLSCESPMLSFDYLFLRAYYLSFMDMKVYVCLTVFLTFS